MEIENPDDILPRVLSKIFNKHKIPFIKYSVFGGSRADSNKTCIYNDKIMISYVSDWLKKRNIKLPCIIIKNVKKDGVSDYITEQIFLGSDKESARLIKDILIVYSYALCNKQLLITYVALNFDVLKKYLQSYDEREVLRIIGNGISVENVEDMMILRSMVM